MNWEGLFAQQIRLKTGFREGDRIVGSDAYCIWLIITLTNASEMI